MAQTRYNRTTVCPNLPKEQQPVRYLVISDIHANLQALLAVLAHAPSVDEVWCLGDLVGYGPNPNECIERVRELPRLFCLAGNHDWAALGQLDLSHFNVEARLANTWTQSVLSEEAREYLQGLPVRAEHEGVTLAHASPREPVWEYLLDTAMARANFGYFSTPLCLVGHSHLPLAFEWDEGRRRCEFAPELFETSATGEIVLSLEGRRLILNPGSVGQPRDGDPRAAYAILDTDRLTWEVRRVPYPVEITQERMRAQGLPRRLIERLAHGR
jgi:diadenosine tetraphosphatase ApaH/serine/threonine PP2A family protein phosphatase